ncbi:nucleotidyltransferase domain-containing protein [Thermomicrobiaceae bacterium CFH 74404]|uniref:Nucleotidyltransferase domain-containing protein n=1 Tax=Thermalbibacter longus TaxID=2951981 RepID=A0AA41WAJ4_9BACT|nr:nucleotidyltransferase domain-containing protein [Thermalbibacter longus]MCM8749239.1 nucleotidyltransferase domain-containing protein [Thermalbibacter longus]
MRELARLLPVRRAVLFGSWARGRATARSDVDVLVIYADPPRADAYALVWRTLRTPGLEPHVYAESEAVAIQETLERMTAGGIDLLTPLPGAEHC